MNNPLKAIVLFFEGEISRIEKIKKIKKRSNKFVVLCGPSGSGKNMIIKHLIDHYDFRGLPSLTTRSLRKGDGELEILSMGRDEFMERELDGKIFLPVHNYGNLYGYDINTVLNSIIQKSSIVIESPTANLTTDVAYFLPEAMVIGIIPSTTNELEHQLNLRGLNEKRDKRIRLLNTEIEKEHIMGASELMEINQVVPIPGVPQDTLSQIDRLMEEKGFKKKIAE